jgi:hypothetical protein
MSYHHHNKSTIKKITVVTSGISEHRSVAVGRGNVLIMLLVPTCLYIQGPYWLWSHGCWNTAIYVIIAHHHWCCQFESRSGQGVPHYVIKFVSDLRQIGGFLRVHRFPPPIIPDRPIELKYCWKWREHHQTNIYKVLVDPWHTLCLFIVFVVPLSYTLTRKGS